MSPEVRSSGLKANLSSNADMGGVETDIAISVLLSSCPIRLCFTLVLSRPSRRVFSEGGHLP